MLLLTDMLFEVDATLGFTKAFTNLRIGVAYGDRIGLLDVLLAKELNLGLRKMAEATVARLMDNKIHLENQWHSIQESPIEFVSVECG